MSQGGTPWGALARAGVLGINRRNADYTLRWNDRRLYPRVDDKLLTKRLCIAAGIPTAEVLGVARYHAEVDVLLEALTSRPDFVLKPARGSMGNGILVIVARDGARLQRSGGAWLGRRDLRYHAATIISGLFSLGGQMDVAFAEERLEVHPELREIASGGVPDIRVVVYRGVPVMSMTRLPTKASRGRANLHQGALGAGIDLASGRTCFAVHEGRAVQRHPDTGGAVVGVPVPGFARALEIAVRATDQTGLGYVGADVVVDARQGPLILELNARPGLAIQLANRAGLLHRLRAIDAQLGTDRVARSSPPLEKRLALGQELAISGAV